MADFLEGGMPDLEEEKESDELDFLDEELGAEESEESPLAKFSDEELLDELESRGLGEEDEFEAESEEPEVGGEEDDDDMADIPQPM